MLTTLTKNDCISILSYYNIPIPNDNITLKRVTENAISTNLCKCIENKNYTNRNDSKYKKNIKRKI